VTAVEKYFFTPMYYPRNAWSVMRWWESRRLLFNVCVGSAGVASLGVVTLMAALPPRADFWPPPVAAVLVYGVLANVGYALGAPVDLLLRRVLGDRAPAVGPVLFRYGFVFSMGLTLLPIPVAVLSWVVRFLAR
jgi:hypothetical protein